jgi:hypothetical protein
MTEVLCVGDVITVFFIDEHFRRRRISGICHEIRGRGISRSISLLAGGEALMRFFINSPLVIDIKKLRTLDKIELKL